MYERPNNYGRMRGVFSILLALFPFVAVAADTESAEIARPNLPDLTSEELADASCSEDDASCGDPEPVATGEPGSDEDSGVKYYRGNGGAYDGEPPIDIGPSSSLLDFLDDSLLDEEVLADIRENMLAGKLVVIRDAFKVRSDQQLGYKLHVLNNTLPTLFLLRLQQPEFAEWAHFILSNPNLATRRQQYVSTHVVHRPPIRARGGFLLECRMPRPLKR